MNRKRFVILGVLISFFMWVNGGLAETKGYSDSGRNSVTSSGVLGAKYTGTQSLWSALSGIASATSGATYGGFFQNFSTGGTGVYSLASATTGSAYGGKFQSNSTNGIGVYGSVPAASGYTRGGYFESKSTGGSGVQGFALAKTGSNYGGNFLTSSTGGTAVYGMAEATSGTTYGGRFLNKSTSGSGVYGYAQATSGLTYGGYFLNKSTSGRGVVGIADALSGYTYGGYFQSNSSDGTGVYGQGTTYGGYFENDSGDGAAVYGYSHMGTGGEFKVAEGIAVKGVGIDDAYWSIGVYGASHCSVGYGVYGESLAGIAGGGGYGVYGKNTTNYGYAVYSEGNMKVQGKLTVTGTKSAVVKLKDGQSVLMYAVESSENWFEDFGSSKLKDGIALVSIEATFAETVNTGMEYHVFLTPKGDCRGLYVTNETESSFEVRELNGGKSNIPFSYRIVAKRKGYEDQRLARVDEKESPARATTQADALQKDSLKLASQME